MTERELLDGVLAFWERIAERGAASESLRQEFLKLLFLHRAQWLIEAASLLCRARRSYGHGEIDAVSRYVLAEVEEELLRRAHGSSRAEPPQGALPSDTPH